MPRGDRTGPMGAGSMTGRRAGFCAGYGVPGFANPPAPWCGTGYRGGGYGWRNMYYLTGLPRWQRYPYPVSPVPSQEEVETLKARANWLKDQLDAINKRIEELEQK